MIHVFKKDIYYFQDLNNVTPELVFESSQANVRFMVDKMAVGYIFSPSVFILVFRDNFTKFSY
jgi:hypothetical protein